MLYRVRIDNQTGASVSDEGATSGVVATVTETADAAAATVVATAAATVVPVILAAAETVGDAAPNDAQLLIRVCNVGMAEFIASFGYPTLVLFLGES